MPLHLHRNTFIVFLALAIIATLLLGINIGRKITSLSSAQPTVLSQTAATATPIATAQPTASANASPSATLGPEVKLQPYRNAGCGYSVDYPASWQFEEFDIFGTNLVNSANPSEKITIVCASDLQPPTDSSPTREILLSAVPAVYFADQKAADNTVADAVFAPIPDTDKTIVIAGKGTVFNTALASFQFTQASSSAVPQ